MKKLLLLLLAVLFLLLFLCSCGVVDRLEESHYALYNCKAFIVMEDQPKRYIIANAPGTRFYTLNKHYKNTYCVGDTIQWWYNEEIIWKFKQYKNDTKTRF